MDEHASRGSQQFCELLRLIPKAHRGDVVTPDEVLCRLTAGETG